MDYFDIICLIILHSKYLLNNYKFQEYIKCHSHYLHYPIRMML